LKIVPRQFGGGYVNLDIAGLQTEQLKQFYQALFDWDTCNTQFSIPVQMPFKGVIREDPTEKRLYIGVEDVGKCLEHIVEYGGSVDAQRFEVPGIAVLGLFRDPAGNPMGLVEMRCGSIYVP
jgi:predicted enzyme related to lactoylglutathione lyase